MYIFIYDGDVKPYSLTHSFRSAGLRPAGQRPQFHHCDLNDLWQAVERPSNLGRNEVESSRDGRITDRIWASRVRRIRRCSRRLRRTATGCWCSARCCRWTGRRGTSCWDARRRPPARRFRLRSRLRRRSATEPEYTGVSTRSGNRL